MGRKKKKEIKPHFFEFCHKAKLGSYEAFIETIRVNLILDAQKHIQMILPIIQFAFCL